MCLFKKFNNDVNTEGKRYGDFLFEEKKSTDKSMQKVNK